MVRHEHLDFSFENDVELLTEGPILDDKLILHHLFVRHQAQRVEDSRVSQASLLEKWNVLDHGHETLYRPPVSQLLGNLKLLRDELNDVDLIVLVYDYLLLSDGAKSLE